MAIEERKSASVETPDVLSEILSSPTRALTPEEEAVLDETVRDIFRFLDSRLSAMDKGLRRLRNRLNHLRQENSPEASAVEGKLNALGDAYDNFGDFEDWIIARAAFLAGMEMAQRTGPRTVKH